MADHPNAQIARTAMDAFSKGDLESFAAALDEGVVWHAPGNNRWAGERRGKGETLERFRQQGEAGVRITFDDIHDVLGSDDHAVALLTIRFTDGDRTETSPSIFVMHVRDGKLVEFWATNERQAEIDALLGS